jgi:uncharacterized protein YjiS (DUF1127 family)
MIMSISTTVGPHEQAGGGALGALGGAVKRLLAAYIAWRLEQSAIAVLRTMSDRELKDIGLSRSDIMSAVRAKGPLRRLPACEW